MGPKPVQSSAKAFSELFSSGWFPPRIRLLDIGLCADCPVPVRKMKAAQSTPSS